jgi:ribosomal protein S18 acetylase RimI-like enzyme
MKFEIYLSKANFLSTQEQQTIYSIYEKAFVASKFPISGKWNPDHFLSATTNESYVIASYDTAIVGFIFYTRLSDADLEIWNLSVDPRFWGKGLSDQMLEFLQVDAGEPYQQILLEVHEKNASAIHLYERNHWKITHRRKKYYQDNGDAVLMTFLRGI